MNQVVQTITDPALCAQLQSFDPHKLVGLAGAPAVEQVVQYLRDQWGLSTRLAPVVSLVIGIAINFALALYVGNSPIDALTLGAATGLLASGWHVIRD